MAKDHMTELVFIPFPAMGHLLPTVQMAKKLVAKESGQISITILIITKLLPSTNDKIDSYLQSLKTENNNLITLLEIPSLNTPTDLTSSKFMSTHLESYKPVIKQALIHSPARPRLGGLVLDFFWTSLIDVGNELNIPSYFFFTSGAICLTTMFHFESLHVNIPATFADQSPDETVVHLPGFRNPLPMKVWPATLLDKDGVGRLDILLSHARRFRQAKGILVNTFMELEESIIRSMSMDKEIPPIYPVGPILNIEEQDSSDEVILMRWLDTQPSSSVVFLCFGSMGSFHEDQVKQIAIGLELSGKRFLWSLRRPPHKKGTKVIPVPDEYEDFTQVLPLGFLDRTAEIGKVIGWAPQAKVLAHNAVGGFVSHCGWNSIVESLWFGVPIITWPMYAEQQENAFLLVKELGLAVDIRMDYMCNPREGWANMVVAAQEVESGIRRMMDEEEGEVVRRRVKEMSASARMAVSGDHCGGSSWKFMSQFVEDVLPNLTRKV